MLRYKVEGLDDLTYQQAVTAILMRLLAVGPEIGPGRYFNGQFGAAAERLLEEKVCEEFCESSIIGQFRAACSQCGKYPCECDDC
jgi:hypothetical protein